MRFFTGAGEPAALDENALLSSGLEPAASQQLGRMHKCI